MRKVDEINDVDEVNEINEMDTLILKVSCIRHLEEIGVAVFSGSVDFCQDLGEDASFEVPIPKQSGTRIECINEVIQYILHGIHTHKLFSGECTPEIRYLGAEHLFVQDIGGLLVPLCNQFGQSIKYASSKLWAQLMADMHDRSSVFMSRSGASRATLMPFTVDAMNATPYCEFNPGSLCAVVRNESVDFDNKRVDFDRLVREEGHLVNGVLAGVPWLADGSEGVCLCGGALESMLLGNEPHDYDLFVVCKDDALSDADLLKRGKLIVVKTIDAILRHVVPAGVRVAVLPKKHVVDVIIEKGAGEKITIQIIARVYASPAQVLAGFDIDCCRLAFDGCKNWAHPTALRAWKNGWNLFDETTLSTTAVHRYTKKHLTGMGVVIPGLSQTTVDSIRAVCRHAVEEFDRLFNVRVPEGEFRTQAEANVFANCVVQMYQKRWNMSPINVTAVPDTTHVYSLIMGLTAGTVGKTIGTKVSQVSSDYDFDNAQRFMIRGLNMRDIFPDDNVDNGDHYLSIYPDVLRPQSLTAVEVDSVQMVRQTTDGRTLFTGAFAPIVACIYVVDENIAALLGKEPEKVDVDVDVNVNVNVDVNVNVNVDVDVDVDVDVVEVEVEAHVVDRQGRGIARRVAMWFKRAACMSN